MAQVYSVNAVGYVNLTLKNKYNLICNPLNGTNNNLNTIIPVAPEGAQALRFSTSGQTFSSIDTYIVVVDDPSLNGWYNASEQKTTNAFNPGEAFFLYNPGPQTTITFVGEVPQGTVLSNSIAPRYGFYSSIVPQSVGLDTISFPRVGGMQYTSWNPTSQAYQNTLTYVVVEDSPPDSGWYTAAEVKTDPTPAVGEGFLIYNPLLTASSWVRSFSVNN
jgi:hypothetical protein